MNRGSHGRRVHQVRNDPCFNEAPIHESGKYVADVQADPFRRRFNEAPIHESGKSRSRRNTPLRCARLQ